VTRVPVLRLCGLIPGNICLVDLRHSVWKETRVQSFFPNSWATLMSWKGKWTLLATPNKTAQHKWMHYCYERHTVLILAMLLHRWPVSIELYPISLKILKIQGRGSHAAAVRWCRFCWFLSICFHGLDSWHDTWFKIMFDVLFDDSVLTFNLVYTVFCRPHVCSLSQFWSLSMVMWSTRVEVYSN